MSIRMERIPHTIQMAYRQFLNPAFKPNIMCYVKPCLSDFMHDRHLFDGYRGKYYVVTWRQKFKAWIDVSRKLWRL